MAALPLSASLLPRGDWTPADLAERLSALLAGTTPGFRPCRLFADSDLRWQLDPGNNWALRIEEGCFVLSYRYGKSAAFWAALEGVVSELLDLP